MTLDIQKQTFFFFFNTNNPSQHSLSLFLSFCQGPLLGLLFKEGAIKTISEIFEVSVDSDFGLLYYDIAAVINRAYIISCHNQLKFPWIYALVMT